MRKILLLALEMEKRAGEFYRSQLERVSDPRIRATLKWLADWEHEHVHFIEARLRGDQVGPLPKGDPHPPQAAASPAGARDPDSLAVELTTLRTAMSLEEDARRFYQEAAQRAGNPQEREFFLWLAGWEVQHWQLLDQNYRDLSRDYWEDMDFSPF